MTQMGEKIPKMWECEFLLNVFQASAAGLSDDEAVRLLAGLIWGSSFN